MYLLLSEIVVVTLVFIQIQFVEISSLRLSLKCPYGNYFTDGCVSCWCDPGNGQRVCENMITCPRKNVKCPMGRTYQDECSNDCTCYENTGAIFCKEKGPCNSIRRRNTFIPPPSPPSPPAPHIMGFVDQEKSKHKNPMMQMQEDNHHDTFHIPNSVPIHKENLIIEPALIIRRKSLKGEVEKKKHPTTLLYLYEKQLKSMKEFKNYYKHYLNSQNNENGPSNMGEIMHHINNHDKNEEDSVTSLFSASTNLQTKYAQPQNAIIEQVPVKDFEIVSPPLVRPPSGVNANTPLEIEIPLRNFKVASSSSRPPQDFHYIFRNMKQNGDIRGSKYRDNSFRTESSTRIPVDVQYSNSSSHQRDNNYPIQHAQEENSHRHQTFSTTPPPLRKWHSTPIATVYNVVSSTMRPNFNDMSPSSTPRPFSSSFFSGSTPRPQFISYITPNRSASIQAPSNMHHMSSFSTPHFDYKHHRPTTPRPQDEFPHHNDHKISGSSSERYSIRAELNKPIFVNHIVATRRYPDIYMNKNFNNNNNVPYFPQPLPPPPTHRPTQYRLFLKNMENKPQFYSDRNRVPLFVDKIAREFFRKPAIFVPKIKTVRGKQELQLNRVVYHHKEMIPKELVLEPGGPPLKVKFTPEAEREMNQEWLQALKDQRASKVEQSLGYHHQPSSLNHQEQQFHQYYLPNNHHHHPEFSQTTQHYDHNTQQNSYPQRFPAPTQHSSKYTTHDTSRIYQHTLQHSQPQHYFHHENYQPHPYSSGTKEYIQNGIPQRNDNLPMPNPIQIPPYTEIQDTPQIHNGGYPDTRPFQPGPPYEESIYPSPQTPLDYPVIEQPPYDTPHQHSNNVVIMEHNHHDNPYPPHQMSHDLPSYKPPTATEPQADFIPVSPRPDFTQHQSDTTFEIPTDAMDDFGFPNSSPSGYFSDMISQASGDYGPDSDTDSGTLLIDSFKKADEVTQPTNEPRPRIRIQDVLAHKRGQQQHIRIKSEPPTTQATTTTTTTTTTTPTPPSTTTEEFDPEKVLREILAMDPDIGPDAILFKENGETIPPLRSTTTTSPTTTTTPLPNIPNIQSKGDIGILPQEFDPQYQVYLTSTATPPNPNRSNADDPLSFDQFYQDLFRPQRKREEVVKPDGIVDADGVAKIFHYDSIIKNFKSGDSEEISRNLDKRDHENKTKAKRLKGKGSSSSSKTKKRKGNIETETTTTKISSSTTSTEMPSIISKLKNEPANSDDPNSSFKRELDWKSKLMADICTVNPDSALCFTYKSLCMLMTS